MNSIAEKKTRLAAEVSSLERRLEEVAAETESLQARLNAARGGLAVLSELEAEQNNRSTESLLQFPGINLREAVHKAAVSLKKFTRRELEQWIRSEFPQLQFKTKSVYAPLEDLVAAGKVVMLRPNTGNKVPAVYGIKEQAGGGNKQPKT